jgi:hypothetical protein
MMRICAHGLQGGADATSIACRLRSRSNTLPSHGIDIMTLPLEGRSGQIPSKYFGI